MRVPNAVNKKLALHKVVRLRQRYYLTRNKRLRLRYVVTSVAACALVGTGFVGIVGSSISYIGISTQLAAARLGTSLQQASSSLDVASVSALFTRDDIPSNKDEALVAEQRVFATVEPPSVSPPLAAKDPTESADPKSESILTPELPEFSSVDEGAGVSDEVALKMASIAPYARYTPEVEEITGPREEIVKVGTGETVAGVLQSAGVSGTDAYNAVKALSEHFDPRDVKAGQAISVKLEPGQDGLEFAEMNMKIDPIKEVVVSKSGQDNFDVKVKEKDVVLQTNAVKASIEDSLYGSAARAGIPASVVSEMIRIYSYQIDFQRDIREGDKVEVLYETYQTEDGDFARYGNVLYANLVVSGNKYPVYRYETKDGRADYYGLDGISIKKTLMRTPVDGARISSGFGVRRHPISGYTKMHKGIDFAASLGTPVYAAGDGVVEIAGRKGTYGNYIRIRHNNKLQTAYAHLHKISKGVTPGKTVKQGQIIGYVGSTGRSTGPHLHYEVLKANAQVNPNSIDLPIGQQLAGNDLERFKAVVSSLSQQYATLTEGLKYAQNDMSSR